MNKFSRKLVAGLTSLPRPGIAASALFADPDLQAPVIAGGVSQDPDCHWLVIASTMTRAESLAADIRAWLRLLCVNTAVHVMPEFESGKNQLSPEHECERSRVLDLVSQGPAIFVASIAAALAPSPTPEDFRQEYRRLRVGDRSMPPERLAAILTDLDYDNETEVRVPGEFSWRGGILDVFCPVYANPIRLDYFGDELESIRIFDPETQRSIEPREECLIIPRGETMLRRRRDRYANFPDHFQGKQVRVVLCDPDQLARHLETFADADQSRHYEELGSGRYPVLALESIASAPDRVEPRFAALSALFSGGASELAECRETLVRQLLHSTCSRWHQDGYELAACCSTRAKLERFVEILHEHPELTEVAPELIEGEIRCGVLFPDQKLVLLSEAEIFGLTPSFSAARKPRPVFHADHLIHGTTELNEGEFAVHAAYGICKFNGLRMDVFNGQLQEVLSLGFANHVEVLVPLEQACLVSRYVGAGKKLPKLSKVGAATWRRACADAADSVRDMASELLRIQALRSSNPGLALDGDTHEIDLFEDAFPYTETEDQAQAATEVYADMSRARPMDRLLCGDVGFGKTEVAMRAAFKAVLCGKQVAVLVPTTVLCQQHLLTFTERFKGYPILIQSLSRFASPGQQRQIIQNLAEGKVDIVIGTHRLLSADLRFRDLGLMIVDEEQRFGVQHKEKLKQLRVNVDILTMTATPIPRTLYLAMAGLRDMSTIVTPPLDRLPVKTIVAQYSDELVREGIVREIQRGGQVFFLHNRVKSIARVASKLAKQIPEASIDVGHGQMHEHELEEVMLKFIEGKTDVLVCTTIIESGIDIPNANTILIDRADRFGLAELYQLRGRVGRYHRQAYAYLLIPPHGMMIDSARQRLGAIRQYTQLGSGFRLALRDLEIRGAGNILGREQSGHIAAVGFDLYCQLLEEAVRVLQGKAAERRPQISLITDFIAFGHTAEDSRTAACLPMDYIHEESIRVGCYRELSRFQDEARLDDYREELHDRFGEPPEAVDNYLTVMRLKIVAAKAGIHSISVRDQKVYLESATGLRKDRYRQIPKLTTTAPSAKLYELLSIVRRL